MSYSYTITHTNGDVLTIVTEGNQYNTESDYTTAEKGISFLGPNFNGYGRLVANNFLHLLENAADVTPPTYPITGQLWWDKSTNTLNVFNGARFKPFANNTIGNVTPVSPSVGDQWWDTSVSQLKIYGGTQWDLVGPLNLTNSSFLLGTITNAQQLGNVVAANYLDKTVASNSLTGNLTILGTTGLTVGNTNTVKINTTAGSATISSLNSNVAVTAGAASIILNVVDSTITISQEPTVSSSITTKNYVDTTIADNVRIEGYTGDAAYTVGTVVVFGGANEVTVSNIANDPRVAGVVTSVTNPIIGLPVVLMGKAICKVIGPVTKGDILVTAFGQPGVATVLPPGSWVPGCVVGKSLVTDPTSPLRNIAISVGKF